MQDKQLSFEAALEKLEAIVNQLEQDDLPLEQALEAFEKGIRLSRYCAQCLDQAEKRIEELTKGPEGTPELKPWDGDDEVT